MAKFIAIPFADQGNKTAVPDTGSASGAMSYQFGYTPNFSAKLGVDANALPIGRLQFNQLMNDLSGAIRQYQTEGSPDWITTTDNDGTPFAYDLYAQVRHNGSTYTNLIAANTVEPGTDGSWLLTNGGYATVPTGVILPYAGATAPNGFLFCDGSSHLITAPATLNLYNTIGYAFGGDTGTSFLLPLTARMVLMGAGGAPNTNPGGVNSIVVGGTGGEESHTLAASETPPHVHTFPPVSGSQGGEYLLANDGGGTVINSGTSTNKATTSGQTGAVAYTAGQTPGNITQPSLLTNFIIKL